MSYTLNIHHKRALSVRSSVRPSVSQSVGPSIGHFVSPSAGWMHRCLPVRLVKLAKKNSFEKKNFIFVSTSF